MKVSIYIYKAAKVTIITKNLLKKIKFIFIYYCNDFKFIKIKQYIIYL